jgi:hypothetical protein
MRATEEVLAQLKSEALKAGLKSTARSTLHEGYESLPNLRQIEEAKVCKYWSSLIARKKLRFIENLHQAIEGYPEPNAPIALLYSLFLFNCTKISSLLCVFV